MIIRRATLADVADIRAVGHSAWHDTYTDIAPIGYVEAGLSHYWTVAAIERAIQAVDTILLVAAEGEQVIGTAQTQILDQHEAVLWQCYVLKAHRGCGVGKLLVTATLWVLPSGIDTYFTEYLSTNANAAAFYAAQGFVFDRIEIETFNGAPLVFTWVKRALRAPSLAG